MVKTLPSNARDEGSIPGQGTEIPHVLHGQENIEKVNYGGFPGGSVVTNPPANAGDMRHRFDP